MRTPLPLWRRDAKALKAILADFPGAVIVLEGHCDERGSAEYNLGLGDRRAASARGYLEALERALRTVLKTGQLRKGKAAVHGVDRGVLANEPASSFCQWGISFWNQLNLPCSVKPSDWGAGRLTPASEFF